MQIVFFCIDVLGSSKGGPRVLHFSPGAWLAIAILMEIPMAMILLSRILKPRANRWANIVADYHPGERVTVGIRPGARNRVGQQRFARWIFQYKMVINPDSTHRPVKIDERLHSLRF